MPSKSVIEINGLYYSYEKETVLENINLNIPERSFLGVVAPTVQENLR